METLSGFFFTKSYNYLCYESKTPSKQKMTLYHFYNHPKYFIIYL